MATKGKTEKELWQALEGLDDDLLDPDLPDAVVDEELVSLGLDPASLAKRGRVFVVEAKEQERLSWQIIAQERRSQLHSRAAGAAAKVPAGLDRQGLLAHLDELRRSDPNVGAAIKMAARKRRPEESTDDELRALLAEMEALRAISFKEPGSV